MTTITLFLTCTTCLIACTGRMQEPFCVPCQIAYITLAGCSWGFINLELLGCKPKDPVCLAHSCVTGALHLVHRKRPINIYEMNIYKQDEQKHHLL